MFFVGGFLAFFFGTCSACSPSSLLSMVTLVSRVVLRSRVSLPLVEPLVCELLEDMVVCK
jgi:hypothetical protein